MLDLGMKFSSFKIFLSELEAYKSQKHSEFYIADSKNLDLMKNKSFSQRIQYAPPELKYYFIKYTCIHAGMRRYQRETYERKRPTRKMNCPAMISLRLSDDGKSLEVIKLIEDHNHEVSAELFHSLASQRRLDPGMQREVMNHLALNADKKLIQKKYSALTQKKITMKDLRNLAARAKSRKADIKETVDVNKEPIILSTALKLKKAEILTNKLAELLSESSSFDEQMDFLQSVYDHWAKGKVSLSISEVTSQTNSSKSFPKTSQPTSALKEIVEPNRKTTPTIISIPKPNVCDATVPTKVQTQLKGIRGQLLSVNTCNKNGPLAKGKVHLGISESVSRNFSSKLYPKPSQPTSTIKGIVELDKKATQTSVSIPKTNICDATVPTKVQTQLKGIRGQVLSVNTCNKNGPLAKGKVHLGISELVSQNHSSELYPKPSQPASTINGIVELDKKATRTLTSVSIPKTNIYDASVPTNVQTQLKGIRGQLLLFRTYSKNEHWAEGKVNLGFLEVAPQTLSSVSFPKTSQPASTFKGIVELDKKATRTVTPVSIRKTNICDATVPIKVQGRPKGIRATPIGKKRKIISVVKDTSTILRSHHNTSQTSCGISESMDV